MVGGTILFAGTASAMPPALTLGQLLDICASSTVAQAAAKGDGLRWRRVSDAQLADWRSRFVAYNGGSVEALGWQRGEKEGDGLLSFWTARGKNAHRACAYSVRNPGGLLDALIAHFGPPKSLDRYDFGTTATWKQGAVEISFSQVGSSAVLNIATTIGH
ncbi:MAG: hypothetical protein JO273_25510 [Methylobacteriaceae bacterium]|nr:hypothetical protein [Methylobacteriaceae bacterium]